LSVPHPYYLSLLSDRGTLTFDFTYTIGFGSPYLLPDETENSYTPYVARELVATLEHDRQRTIARNGSELRAALQAADLRLADLLGGDHTPNALYQIATTLIAFLNIPGVPLCPSAPDPVSYLGFYYDRHQPQRIDERLFRVTLLSIAEIDATPQVVAYATDISLETLEITQQPIPRDFDYPDREQDELLFKVFKATACGQGLP